MTDNSQRKELLDAATIFLNLLYKIDPIVDSMKTYMYTTHLIIQELEKTPFSPKLTNDFLINRRT